MCNNHWVKVLSNLTFLAFLGHFSIFWSLDILLDFSINVYGGFQDPIFGFA